MIPLVRNNAGMSSPDLIVKHSNENDVDKIYGHDPGTYILPQWGRWGVNKEWKPEHIRDKLRAEMGIGSYVIWYYFNNAWAVVTKKDLLDPGNLKLRREFNETIAELKKEYKQKFGDK